MHNIEGIKLLEVQPGGRPLINNQIYVFEDSAGFRASRSARNYSVPDGAVLGI